MGHGLAFKHHQDKKAKAKAKRHFQALFTGQDWWKTPKEVGKKAATTSVCGTSGCQLCGLKGLAKAYRQKWHDSKQQVLE